MNNPPQSLKLVLTSLVFNLILGSCSNHGQFAPNYCILVCWSLCFFHLGRMVRHNKSGPARANAIKIFTPYLNLQICLCADGAQGVMNVLCTSCALVDWEGIPYTISRCRYVDVSVDGRTPQSSVSAHIIMYKSCREAVETVDRKKGCHVAILPGWQERTNITLLS